MDRLRQIINLGYVCSFCNRNKGSDIGSIVWRTGQFYRFFNPRIDRWADHFALSEVRIDTLAEIGEVTARILDFNHVDHLIERQELEALGRYPSPDAFALISGKQIS